MTLILCTLAATMGAIVGSFFNVLIYRLPRGESIVLPASHCPRCSRPIRWYENIPVVSYLFLHGRCRGCKAPISIQYPLVELITALAMVALWLFYVPAHTPASGIWWHYIPLFFQCTALMLLIPIVFIDLRHYIIPDVLSLPLGAISVIIAFLPGGLTPLDALFGILAGSGFLLLMGLIGEYILKKKDSMGGGDIKLMFGIGALFGWQITLIAVMLAALLGALIGGTLLLARKLDNQHRIAFGPFLAIGIAGAVWRGDRLAQWYISLLW